MSFGTFLVRQGVITPMQLMEAVEKEEESRPPIGRLALEMEKLSMRQLFQVLAEQAQSSKLFGQIAIELGFISQQDIADLLLLQADRAVTLPKILLQMGVFDEVTLRQHLREYYRYEMVRQNVINDHPPAWLANSNR